MAWVLCGLAVRSYGGVLDGKGFICSLSRDVSPESPDLCLLAVIGGLKLAV